MRRRLPLTLFGLTAVLAVLCPSAATSPAAATRAVTLTLTASGRGTFTANTPHDRGTTTMRYRWSGRVRLVIPNSVLRNPARAKFVVGGSTTLTGRWDGTLSGTKVGGIGAGPYRCTYTGRSVRTRVGVFLRNGPRRGTLELRLRPRGVRFFNGAGPGATTSCTSLIGAQGPTHFDPGWMFRDTVTDHDRLSSRLAVVSVPSRLLPRRTVRVTFPREVGRSTSPLRGTVSWNNRGSLTARAR